MNRRIRKKQQKQREQRKELEMKWLLDLANAIDAGIREWQKEMERRYVELYAEEVARRMGLVPKQ